jgi:ABC-type nitrate/sulfonate/bicarbonate transport system substrate-binding protein
MRARRAWLVAAIVAAALSVVAAGCGGGNDSGGEAAGGGSLTKIRMVQEWPVPDAFWIPWVVAKEKGYYEDAGIDLQIIPPPTVADTVKFLGTGRADIGFTTILDVIFAKDQDAHVVSIGANSQSNNWGLIGRQGETFSIADLKGKKVGIYNDAWTKAQLAIMLKSADLTLDDIQMVADPSDTIPLLLQKKVDVATGVTNAEASEMRTVGKQTPEMLLAKDYGVPDSPIWLIAANSGWAADHADLVKKWYEATKKGLDDAIADPQAAVDAFLKVYPDAMDPAYALDQWTNTIPLFSSSDGVFSQNDAQWGDLLPVLQDQGLIKKALAPSDYYTNDYLPGK